MAAITETDAASAAPSTPSAEEAIEAAAQAVERAESRVARLQKDITGLGDLFRQAARAADTKAMRTIREKRAELADELAVAQIAQAGAELALAAARVELAQQRCGGAYAAAGEAVQALEQAEREHTARLSERGIDRFNFGEAIRAATFEARLEADAARRAASAAKSALDDQAREQQIAQQRLDALCAAVTLN